MSYKYIFSYNSELEMHVKADMIDRLLISDLATISTIKKQEI
jgi:hypothetical protein